LNKKEDIENIIKSFDKIKMVIRNGHYKAATNIINKLYNRSLELDFKKGIFLYYENYIEILFETHENHLILPFLMHVIKKKNLNISKLGTFYTKLGIVLSRLHDFDSSIIYLQKSLEIHLSYTSIKINNVIISYIGLTENSFRQLKYDEALKYINLGFKEFKKRKKVDNKNDYFYFYLIIFKTRVLLKKGEFKKAKLVFNSLDSNLLLFRTKDSARYKELELEFMILDDAPYKTIIEHAQIVLKLAIELENVNLRKRILMIFKDFHTKNNELDKAYKYVSQILKIIKKQNSKNKPILHNKNIELPKEIINEQEGGFEIYLKKDIKIALKYQYNFFQNKKILFHL